MTTKTLENLTALYHYLDEIVEQDASADDLFASSYIRGFIALSASEFGDESQALSAELAQSVEQKLLDAKSECTPQDQLIVQQYWLDLKGHFAA